MESSAQGAGEPGGHVGGAPPPPPATPPPGPSPAEAHAAAGADSFAERPELFVGAAFAGGLLAAQILKRLGRR